MPCSSATIPSCRARCSSSERCSCWSTWRPTFSTASAPRGGGAGETSCAKPGAREGGAGGRRGEGGGGGPCGGPPLRSVRRAWLPVAGLGIVGVLALAALLAPMLPLGSPTDISKDFALRGPTAAEPFGRDDLGRSLLSRVIHAYRVSLGVAVTSALLAVLVGGPLGLVAGYAEGLPDQLIMRPLDVLMAFPAVLLAIALMSVFGTGALLLSVALAVVYTPVMARVARAAVLATKNEEYVDGARALGATEPPLVLTHILPNAAAPKPVHD